MDQASMDDMADFDLDEVLYRKKKPVFKYPVKSEQVGIDGFERIKPNVAERTMVRYKKWFKKRNIPFDIMDIKESVS